MEDKADTKAKHRCCTLTLSDANKALSKKTPIGNAKAPKHASQFSRPSNPRYRTLARTPIRISRPDPIDPAVLIWVLIEGIELPFYQPAAIVSCEIRRFRSYSSVSRWEFLWTEICNVLHSAYGNASKLLNPQYLGLAFHLHI
jgi:hypothetical protein